MQAAPDGRHRPGQRRCKNPRGRRGNRCNLGQPALVFGGSLHALVLPAAVSALATEWAVIESKPHGVSGMICWRCTVRTCFLPKLLLRFACQTHAACHATCTSSQCNHLGATSQVGLPRKSALYGQPLSFGVTCASCQATASLAALAFAELLVRTAQLGSVKSDLDPNRRISTSFRARSEGHSRRDSGKRESRHQKPRGQAATPQMEGFTAASSQE